MMQWYYKVQRLWLLGVISIIHVRGYRLMDIWVIVFISIMCYGLDIIGLMHYKGYMDCILYRGFKCWLFMVI
jgi:hypothetical protein